MLYFEDFDSLRSTLCADDLVSVLDAMVALSRTGTFSDEEKLSDAAKICWRFMKPRIERDSKQYEERVKKRRDAANARWNAQASANASASTCNDEMRMQNFVPTQPNSPQRNPTQRISSQPNAAAAHISDSGSHPPSERIEAFDGSDLSGQVANLQRANGLISRYRLPDCDASREALLEDAERVGWENLEDALGKAAASNSRQGLSINFYRTVMNDAFRSPSPTLAKGLHAVPTAEEYSKGVDPSGFGWA